MSVCNWSGKICYPDHGRAVAALEGLQRRVRRKIYLYRCPRCHLWHLTKRPKNKSPKWR